MPQENPQPRLKGFSVSLHEYKDADVAKTLSNTCNAHGVKPARVTKELVRIASEQWEALSHEEQAKALGLRPF